MTPHTDPSITDGAGAAPAPTPGQSPDQAQAAPPSVPEEKAVTITTEEPPPGRPGPASMSPEQAEPQAATDQVAASPSGTEATSPDKTTPQVAHGHPMSMSDKTEEGSPQVIADLERRLAVFQELPESTAHEIVQTLPDGSLITPIQIALCQFGLKCEQDAVYHEGMSWLCKRMQGKSMELLSRETGLTGYRLYDRYRLLSGSQTGDKQLSRYKRVADDENWAKIMQVMSNPLMKGVTLTWPIIEEILKPGDDEGAKISAARRAAAPATAGPAASSSTAGLFVPA